ncbi:hypothetical protein YC2023_033664 [Brassica napus]
MTSTCFTAPLLFLQTHDIRHNLHALGSYISRVSISGFPSTTPTHVSGDETSSIGVTDGVPPFPLWCAESECRLGSTMQVHDTRNCHSGPRSPGVPPELSKGRYGHVSTHLDNPTCPSCAQGNGNGGMSNKLLSEVTLDQPARMTLYTTLCGN